MNEPPSSAGSDRLARRLAASLVRRDDHPIVRIHWLGFSGTISIETRTSVPRIRLQAATRPQVGLPARELRLVVRHRFRGVLETPINASTCLPLETFIVPVHAAPFSGPNPRDPPYSSIPDETTLWIRLRGLTCALRLELGEPLVGECALELRLAAFDERPLERFERERAAQRLRGTEVAALPPRMILRAARAPRVRRGTDA